MCAQRIKPALSEGRLVPDRATGTAFVQVPPARLPCAERAADIAVIDGDAALRDTLAALLHSIGLKTRLYASADGLIENGSAATVSCFVVDVRLPGIGGLEFQARLLEQNIRTPVVFMTAHGDIKMAVRAMKAGAIDFLTKPLRDQDLLDAVAVALDQVRHQRQVEDGLSVLQARLASLTPREAQMLGLVTAGLRNKQIAGELTLSEVTVKMHRGSLMQKMGARTVAELTRMATALKLPMPQGVPVWHARAPVPDFARAQTLGRPFPDLRQMPAIRGPRGARSTEPR